MFVEFDAKVSQLAGGAPGAEVKTAALVRDVLYEVAKAFPSLHLFNCEGEIRAIMRVRRNNQPAALTEPLAETDTLRLGVG